MLQSSLDLKSRIVRLESVGAGHEIDRYLPFSLRSPSGS